MLLGFAAQMATHGPPSFGLAPYRETALGKPSTWNRSDRNDFGRRNSSIVFSRSSGKPSFQVTTKNFGLRVAWYQSASKITSETLAGYHTPFRYLPSTMLPVTGHKSSPSGESIASGPLADPCRSRSTSHLCSVCWTTVKVPCTTPPPNTSTSTRAPGPAAFHCIPPAQMVSRVSSSRVRFLLAKYTDKPVLPSICTSFCQLVLAASYGCAVSTTLP
mmetsp:Transcript_29/g.72  ORF Transcript_29/g.72 Transcript_29/m.72 type:complete len:217 (-) Transcript_29:209-859(-)